MALHYEIRLNCPKEIDLTIEQFKSLSYYGLGCLWCDYKILFYYNKNKDLEMYFHNYEIYEVCKDNYRFTGIDWFEIESAEMYHCTIPKSYKVIKSIEKYFSYLIMK